MTLLRLAAIAALLTVTTRGLADEPAPAPPADPSPSSPSPQPGEATPAEAPPEAAPQATTPPEPRPVSEAPPASEAPAIGKAPPTSQARPATEAPKERDLTLACTAWTVGGVGLAAGTIFGILAVAAKSDLDDQCSGARACPESARDTHARLERSGFVSTIGFGVGIVSALLGTYLYYRAPKKPAAPASATSPLRIAF